MDQKCAEIQKVQYLHWAKLKYGRRKPCHPTVRAVFEPFADIIASDLKNPMAYKVLDVGCGNGFLQWGLEKRFGFVVGLDYSRPMMAINPCMEKCIGTCTNLPFPNESFDIAVAANLLHHLTEPDRIETLKEMKRVARLKIAVFEPNRNNPFVFAFSLLRLEERMALSFSASYMKNLFKSIGLFDVQVNVRGWIVPNKAPAWWIPIGHAIGQTPFRNFGFETFAVGQVKPWSDEK